MIVDIPAQVHAKVHGFSPSFAHKNYNQMIDTVLLIVNCFSFFLVKGNDKIIHIQASHTAL